MAAGGRAAASKHTPLEIAAWLALALTVPTLLWAMVHTIQVRPTWYDEFYTAYVTQPGFGWWEALTRHWLTDNHPPLFYALARAAGWLGDAIEARRFLNLIIAVLAFVGGAAALRGDKSGRLPAILFFVLLAAQGAALPFYGELRSYILSYCSTALMVLAAVLVWIGPAPACRTRKAVLFGATVAAFNTHVLTSVIAAAMLAPFVAAAWIKQDRERLRAVLVPALVGGGLFCATVAVQYPGWIANTRQFWIPAGVGQAWGSLRIVANYAFAANQVMVLGGLAGVAMMAVRARRAGVFPPAVQAALLLGCGVVLAGGLCLALQAWRPSVIPKYMIALIPGLGMIVALGFADLAEGSRRIIGPALVLVAALMTTSGLVRQADAMSGQKGWDAAARIIARQVAACPATLVHTDLHWNSYLAALQPADNARVLAWSYRHVAARHGFAVEPARSRRMAGGGCPTLFWAHRVSQSPPSAADVLLWQRSRGFALDRLYLRQIGDAWIASDRRI